MNTIIYINYSPYENSGKILDYLKDDFANVLHFSIGFHNLKNKRDYNMLHIFKDGKLQKEYKLFQLPVHANLVFLLLPIRSIINFVQIFIYSLWLKQKYGKIDIFFTVNAFIAWIGNFLRGFKVVDKTVFWVWDYYPPIHENKIIMLMRYIYWQFDRISSYSDKVVFVNNRLLDLRRDMGIYEKNSRHLIIPIGTDRFPFTNRKKPKNVTLGFIGVVKKSLGVSIVFDNAKELLEKYPDVRYEVIGSGPDEYYMKRRARASGVKTNFYGYMDGDSFNDVLKKCTIGVAMYYPDKTNVSYYGDPGKIKRYISLGIPVITTDILEFSNEIRRTKSGIIVDYDNPQEFVFAIDKIMRNYPSYSSNAYNLSQKFYYKKIYPAMFRFYKK